MGETISTRHNFHTSVYVQWKKRMIKFTFFINLPQQQPFFCSFCSILEQNLHVCTIPAIIVGTTACCDDRNCTKNKYQLFVNVR